MTTVQADGRDNPVMKVAARHHLHRFSRRLGAGHGVAAGWRYSGRIAGSPSLTQVVQVAGVPGIRRPSGPGELSRH